MKPRRRYTNTKVTVTRGDTVEMNLRAGPDGTVKVRDAVGTITMAFDPSFDGVLYMTTQACPNPRAHLSLLDRLAEVVDRFVAWGDRHRHVSWPESMEHE